MRTLRHILLIGILVLLPGSVLSEEERPSSGTRTEHENWYRKSFFLLHEDHHTQGAMAVGRDANVEQVERLVTATDPDVVQIHAKGNPGWTTYPSKVGHVPPQLQKDVLKIWENVAREHGYHWSIYYNIGRDAEIMRRHPEWNRSHRDGTEQERALCYHSGVAEEYLWPMIREILAGYHPDSFWFDGSVFTIRSCYCKACRRRFQIPEDRPLPTAPGDPGWREFQEMHRQIYRDFVHDTGKLIHQNDPDCLIAFNWICSVRMPEKPDEHVNYLSGDIANRVEGLSLEGHWYDGVGLPFDLMTTGHTFIEEDGRKKKVAKPFPQIAQEMAVIIANGGRYHLWDSPSGTSGLDETLHRFYAQQVGPFLRERQEWCLDSRRCPEVSVLHSKTAHYSLADKGNIPFSRRNNRIEGVDDQLTRLHIDYEMVGTWRLLEGDIRTDWLIVEHPKALALAEIKAIERFVEGGGHLLLTGMGPVIQKGALATLCGLEMHGVDDSPNPITIRDGDKRYTANTFLFDFSPTDAEAVVQARREGTSKPLITRRQVGRGEAWYIGVPFLCEHGPSTLPLELVEAMIEKMLPPEKRRLFEHGVPEYVHLLLRKKENAHVLHVVNMAKGRRTVAAKHGHYRPISIHSLPEIEPMEIYLKLEEKPSSVKIIPGEKELRNWEYRNGVVRLQTPTIPIHAMVVLEK